MKFRITVDRPYDPAHQDWRWQVDLLNDSGWALRTHSGYASRRGAAFRAARRDARLWKAHEEAHPIVLEIEL
jgi:hypothetical protein